MNLLKLEPVRLYSIVAAGVALVAHYVPHLPVALILGVAAAVLGQAVREQVTPNVKVVARKKPSLES